MDKTAHSEFSRLFLLEGLPEPLSAASAHLQILDRYLNATRLRVRQVRDPYTDQRIMILQKRVRSSEHSPGAGKLSEIHLAEAETAVFERMTGPEVRKNRYFHEVDGCGIIFDVYLGPVRGLTTAKIEFASVDAATGFSPPPFCIAEITERPLFDGESMATATPDELEAEIASVISGTPPALDDVSSDPD